MDPISKDGRENSNGVEKFTSKQKGFDHGVEDANGGVLNVLEELECMRKRAIAGFCTKIQQSAQNEVAVVEAGFKNLGMSLL